MYEVENALLNVIETATFQNQLARNVTSSLPPTDKANETAMSSIESHLKETPATTNDTKTNTQTIAQGAFLRRRSQSEENARWSISVQLVQISDGGTLQTVTILTNNSSSRQYA